MIAVKLRCLFLAVIFLFCLNNLFAQQSAKQISIGVTEQLNSKFLSETRTINIYLPEDYKEGDTTTYPVIYIPDGGVEEDFIHVVGIVRFNTQPWINRFPKSIVVGIENTNRKRDFTFAVPNLDFLEKVGYKKEDMPYYGGSANYINFLEKELQPFIEKNYRGNKHTTIIGESLAGLLSTEILLKHTDLFESYIIISPSLWWGNESLLTSVDSFQNKLNSKPNVYIGVPAKNEDVRMYNDAEMLYKKLSAIKNIHLFFDYLPDELHSTVMHAAVYNAFKKFYPKTTYSK